MKTILGLDLGVSSIGWALIEIDEFTFKPIRIIGMGSRIIPLSTDDKTQFEKDSQLPKIRTEQNLGLKEKDMIENSLKK
jgi:CRISPR-associated endonuclease Csn1